MTMLDETLVMRLACQDLIVRFSHFLDRGDFADAFALFADDGVWTRGEEVFHGRDQMLAGWQGRAEGSVLRHFATNMMIDADGPNQARGTTYFLCYIQVSERESLVLPLPFDLPFSGGEWHDRFVRTDAGWRFARRDTVRLYENAFYGRGVRYGRMLAARG